MKEFFLNLWLSEAKFTRALCGALIALAPSVNRGYLPSSGGEWLAMIMLFLGGFMGAPVNVRTRNGNGG